MWGKVKWTDEDNEILRQKYGIYAGKIPELQGKFTETAIQHQAIRLGIAKSGSHKVILDGEEMSLSQAARRLGLNSTNVSSMRIRAGWPAQQLVDYLSTMFIRQPDGSYRKLVKHCYIDDTVYIRKDGKLWSPEIYMQEFKPS